MTGSSRTASSGSGRQSRRSNVGHPGVPPLDQRNFYFENNRLVRHSSLDYPRWKRLGVKAGDQVKFVQSGQGIVLVRSIRRCIRTLKGIVPKPTKFVSLETRIWRSRRCGSDLFKGVIYSRLAAIVSANTKNVKKKAYNNIVSVVRTYFKFGYKDHPGKFNPALALPGFRMTAKDRPKVDPFTIREAELIIAASHRMHGEWYGNYQEFLFFTALRQSEVFALEVNDCDLVNGKISITKALVNGKPKNRTKTNQDREVNLCPRALQVLHAQLSLRAQMAAAGMVNHNRVFFTAVGEPFVNTFLPNRRWTEVLETLPLRYRKPYNSRHSFISWRLMVGHNRLLVAQDDGHSVATMKRTYAAWIRGAKPEDIERIKAAMAGRPLADSDDEDRTITSKDSNAPRLAATV
jgi:integrase